MGKEKTLRVFDANLIYLMGSLLFFTVGFTVQQRELYTGLIITQLAVVLLPPFLYLEIRKMNVRQTMRLNRITWRQGLLAALITIFMYPTAVTANLVMLNLLTRIGTIDIPQIPTASSPLQYLRLMLIISVLAGVCEEVFFRGFVLRGYEKLGRRKAVVISAVLFGVFHYNIYNLAGAIVLGLVFGALVIVTDSLYVGIIGHMVNNGFAVTLGYAFNLIGDLLPPEEMEIAEAALGDSLL
ncbi:MAG: type II CAAX endopeptidase family protein, partial [Bacillota bacterium]|nr:type II CAAX endopeptidase family protein [Bacillota bacterium]